jgi:hypothetical protein
MRLLRLAPLALLGSAVVVCAADPPKKPTPKFTLGKDTTVITEPLTADGYLDYETALNDRLRGKITPDTNAVVGLLAATGPKPEGGDLPNDFFKALGIPRPPEQGDYLVKHFQFFADEIRGENSQAFYDRDNALLKSPWQAADSPKHADWLKANDKPLAAAVAVTKRSEYYHPLISRPKDGSPGTLIGALLPLPQKCREIASALTLRAMLRCGEGKFDDAWADILAVHRLGRLVARGSTGIELLVGVALGSIAHQSEQAFIAAVKPDAKTALKCQAELLALPPWPSYAEKLNLGERFVALDMLQSLRRDGTERLTVRRGNQPKPTREEIDVRMSKLDWDAMFRLNTRWYDTMAAAAAVAAAKPTRGERVKSGAKTDAELKDLLALPKLVDAIDQVGKRLGELDDLVGQAEDEKLRTAVSEKIVASLLGLLAPAVQKMGDSVDRAEQYSRHGVLAFALAAYHADHNKYPASLADLSPKYLKSVPDDLFSGKPLIYKPTDGGYLLYSVGVNGADDGGLSFGDEPKGDDLVMRVPRK